MEALKSALGLDVRHIPFKGSGQSVPALVGGQVDMLFAALPSLSGFVKTGQVRLIANNSSRRSTAEPQLPALSEWVPGYDCAPIIGVLAATGTPQYAIDKISTEIANVAKIPEVVQLLNHAGIDAVGGNSVEYGKAVLDENERFGKAVSAAGIKQQE
jgi:tripartite-type tricarboxylate transporter receptor subunit TctC